jgi:hypothetical protein
VLGYESLKAVMGEQIEGRAMPIRSFFEAESLPPRELLVQGVKLTAVSLVLWFCHGPPTSVVEETIRHLINSS